jgi:hypothetical protein
MNNNLMVLSDKELESKVSKGFCFTLTRLAQGICGRMNKENGDWYCSDDMLHWYRFSTGKNLVIPVNFRKKYIGFQNE